MKPQRDASAAAPVRQRREWEALVKVAVPRPLSGHEPRRAPNVVEHVGGEEDLDDVRVDEDTSADGSSETGDVDNPVEAFLRRARRLAPAVGGPVRPGSALTARRPCSAQERHALLLTEDGLGKSLQLSRATRLLAKRPASAASAHREPWYAARGEDRMEHCQEGQPRNALVFRAVASSRPRSGIRPLRSSGGRSDEAGPRDSGKLSSPSDRIGCLYSPPGAVLRVRPLSAQQQQQQQREQQRQQTENQRQVARPARGAQQLGVSPRAARHLVEANGDAKGESLRVMVARQQWERLSAGLAGGKHSGVGELGLECFDDALDHSVDEELQAKLSDGGTAALEAFAPRYGAGGVWEWEPCRVLRFDADSERYIVLSGAEQAPHSVRRLSLRFAEEDAERFEARVGRAKRRKEAWSCAVRLNAVLERWSPKLESIPAMRKPWLESLLRRSVLRRSESAAESYLSDNDRQLRSLLAEAQQCYLVGVRLGVLQYLARERMFRERLIELGVGEVPMPQLDWAATTARKRIAAAHSVHRPEKPIHESAAALDRAVAISGEGDLRLGTWLADLWHGKFLRLLFFDVSMCRPVDMRFRQRFPVAKTGSMKTGLRQAAELRGAALAVKLPCRPAEFRRLQQRHLDTMLEALQIYWRKAVVDQMQDVQAESCNFFTSDMDHFRAASFPERLAKLHLVLAGQLRHLVLRSLAAWEALVCAYAPARPRPAGKCACPDASAGGPGPIDSGPTAPQWVENPTLRALFAARDAPPQPPRSVALDGPFVEPLLRAELVVDSATGLISLSPNVGVIAGIFAEAVAELETRLESLMTLEPDLFPLAFSEADRSPLLDRSALEADGAPAEEVFKVLVAAKARLETAVSRCLLAAQEIAEEYDGLASLLEVDAETYLANLKEDLKALQAGPAQKEADKRSGPAPQEHRPNSVAAVLRNHISAWERAASSVFEVTFDLECAGLVQVDCKELKERIAAKATGVSRAIMTWVAEEARAESLRIAAEYQGMLSRMHEVPRSEAELVSLRYFLDESEEAVSRKQDRCREVHERLSVLEQFRFQLPEPGDFALMWEPWLWPKRVRTTVRKTAQALEHLKTEMMDALKLEQTAFETALQDLEAQAHAFHAFGDRGNMEQLADDAVMIMDALMEALARAKSFARREELFGWYPSEYPQLGQIKADFVPFHKLWCMSSEFYTKERQWTSGPLSALKNADIAGQMQVWLKELRRVEAFLDRAELEEPRRVAQATLVDLQAFMKNVPLIQALASPALHKRHWDEIGALLHDEGLVAERDIFYGEEELTLQALLDLGALRVEDGIAGIQEVAEKEYALERTLHAMMGEWDSEGMRYDLQPYRDSGTYVLRDVDDIMALLDDQLTKVQIMSNSAFIGPIAAQVAEWDAKLQYTQGLLDEWLALQRTWLYLYPIFASADIVEQLPRESRKFAAVDGLWRRSMEAVRGGSSVMAVSDLSLASARRHAEDGRRGSEGGGLQAAFAEGNAQLEAVQRRLSVYLESKRLVFPRFFFLSNEELLEILAQTKDPRAVQPHLAKSFEGIHRIEFEGAESADMRICAIQSLDGERVPLVEPVLPNAPGVRGKVELWMLEVEARMLEAVRTQIKDAFGAYTQASRTRWALEWPGQAVLCSNEIHWTRRVEDALEGGQEDVVRVLAELEEQVGDVVHLVRGPLAKLSRKTLSALVVVDVHARDVVDRLRESRVAAECSAGEAMQSFAWQSQLRSYLVQGPCGVGSPSSSMRRSAARAQNRASALASSVNLNVMVQIITARQLYAFEYLGNSSRLVITPLTDRCYRTLMGAVALNYGGAPAGPAGTGKTETVKDLAKALAVQCVVFNGSEGLNCGALAKFFKGLAASGAWACFDEFNRIGVEVLSVVGQQIATIQNAKRERAAVFTFEGTGNLPLRQSCNVFVTMNPGYAGRSELPDNLAALFRPCAMMVPDYALIAEIVLYSNGFADARKMARKITQVLRLCSEQLSEQDHYDYGMRSVKTILCAAGRLKRGPGGLEASEAALTLRAVCSASLPRFVEEDLPLFRGIVRDLFPGMPLPEPENAPLSEALARACAAQKLQPKPAFLLKCVEVFETMQVRHGNVLLGPTLSGKSRALDVLCAALSENESAPVQRRVFNPKALELGQLYGCFDHVTREWRDGVLAICARAFSNDATLGPKWIVFDGPVDAGWIVNTALDDNKKLCLNSGEIIRLTDSMLMLYEVTDLAVASPATVSRCGMVLFDPQKLGWRALAQSFVDHQLPSCLAGCRGFILGLFEAVLPPILQGLLLAGDTSMSMIIEQGELQLVRALVALFSATLVPMRRIDAEAGQLQQSLAHLDIAPDDAEAPVAEVEHTETRQERRASRIHYKLANMFARMAGSTRLRPFLAANFAWAVAWSLGASLGTHVARERFEELLLSVLRQAPVPASPGEDLGEDSGEDPGAVAERASLECFMEYPANEGVFDSYVCLVNSPEDDWEFAWKQWDDRLAAFRLEDEAPGTALSDIIVPTQDLMRCMHVVRTLVATNHHVLLVGPTGTGKSACIGRFLRQEMDHSKFMGVQLQFSAQCTAGGMQGLLAGQLERRRKGVLGPPVGKRAVVFVDDLNMPRKEQYGAQPPIELLRQVLGQGGWYDLKDKRFQRLADLQLVGAMAPPGGGRHDLTARFTRFCNVVNMTNLGEAALQRIYSTIMRWHFVAAAPGMNVELEGAQYARTSLSDRLVTATIDVYQTVVTELLPTPSKSHYLFNIRDLAKVFQGLAQAPASFGGQGSSASARTPDADSWARLWSHECLRVFQDRLISDKDKVWFETMLRDRLERYLPVNWPDVFARYLEPENSGSALVGSRLMFGAFSSSDYEEARSLAEVQDTLQAHLDKYNSESDKPMDIVLFESAVQQVSRILRCIRQPRGHALLVGVGGSGRKSLTALATFIAGHDLIQLESSCAVSLEDWRVQLRRALRTAGAERVRAETETGKPVVVLINDTQVEDESILEDVNSLLNTGSVPSLFAPEEEALIMEACGPAARRHNTLIWDYFIERCRANLHVVLCLSPVSPRLRTWLRDFPSLVNCCYIAWLSGWDASALTAVAQRMLADAKLEAEMLPGVVAVCKDIQESAQALSQRYLEVEGRHFYVTPTSYLELLKLFKRLLGKSRAAVASRRDRFAGGLEKLLATERTVEMMQAELRALQPGLEQATREAGKLMADIARKRHDADQTRLSVEREEALCNEQADAARAIRNECEAELAKALPALTSAIKALRTLKKSDISEVRSMKKPPDGVKLTMEAICIMLGYAPKKVARANGKGKVDDYWEVAQKELLGDSHFLSRLVQYDKDDIPPGIITKILPYTKLHEFTPGVIKKASKAAAGLCKWSHAMVEYDRVAKAVAPKRMALQRANEEHDRSQAELAEKKASLQQVVRRLDNLVADFEEANCKKAELNDKVEACKRKVDRASALTSALAREKVRWSACAEQLAEQLDHITGDVLLSSGVVAYLGPVTARYRADCIAGWTRVLLQRGIPCGSAASFSLAETLGDPVRIRQWASQHLPADAFSVSNAIMMEHSERWPLMIDPQGQANRWIRGMHAQGPGDANSSNRLLAVQPGAAGFERSLEGALQLGAPVLVENVGEVLDGLLEPVLHKQVFRSNGVRMLRLGDKLVPYNDNFRLYMTTTLPNPHYPPEVCVMVNLLNFMATQEGLEDQMLGIIVANEDPQLEDVKERLVLENASNAEQLEAVELRILELLAAASGDILEDEALLNALAASKQTSSKIEQRVAVGAKMQKKNEQAREAYAELAQRAALLYFCVDDLAEVDPMYQYSLTWFIRLFLQILERARPAAAPAPTRQKSLSLVAYTPSSPEDDEARCRALAETFTESLYASVCRSLFAAHKPLFSFMVATRLLLRQGRISNAELHFLLYGATTVNAARPAAAAAAATGWLTEKIWLDILGLDGVWAAHPTLGGFASWAEDNMLGLAEVHNSADPSAPLDALLPPEFEPFQKLLVLRAVRPDRLVAGMAAVVVATLGARFAEPPPPDLAATLATASCTTPLIFVLSPGADPMPELERLAAGQDCASRMRVISMGQGQGPAAERAVAEAVDKGTWVVLQNCHLAVSWLPTLERVCDGIAAERTSASFRLWLTSKPCAKFPVAVLQNSVKITLEPPRGLRANLLASCTSAMDLDGMLARTHKPETLSRLLLALCFFHATVLERRKFGPLGWNKAYDFSESDLLISAAQVCLFVDSFDEAPLDTLHYLIGECNYGGRITEALDRRTANCILKDLMAANDESSAVAAGLEQYRLPPGGCPSGEAVRAYIRALPSQDSPELFGLHANADFFTEQAEAARLVEAAGRALGRGGGAAGHGSAASAEGRVLEMGRDILAMLPSPFDLDQARRAFPVQYEHSMNAVLLHELVHFNTLLGTIRGSLETMSGALKGLVLMNADVEEVEKTLQQARVPQLWMRAAYPSLKPLASFMRDLVARVGFFDSWVRKGRPEQVWLGAFFATHSFLTAVRQDHARNASVPVDTVDFGFEVLGGTAAEPETKPGSTVVSGFFLEGARWATEAGELVETLPRAALSPMPPIRLVPHQAAPHPDADACPSPDRRDLYDCPVYKTAARTGALSTTGHSTNFVLFVQVPVGAADSSHWIKRGVAMLLQS